MRLRAIAFLAAAVAGAASAAERPEDRWNLADLYASRQAWAEDAARLEAQLKQFASCRGRLGESARRLKSCLELHTDFSKRYARLDVYASELLAEDTGAPAALELSEKARILGSKLAEATHFLRPEIQRLGKQRLAGFQAGEKSLAIYRQPLDRIVRAAPHTLDSRGESIVAAFALSQEAASSTHQIFTNAELPWPTVTLSGAGQVKLDQTAYVEHREAPSRADRRLVFEAFWASWKQFEGTLGVNFHESLKKDAIYTRVRKYPDTLTRALDAERLPREVYETLIAEANRNLPTLHRYLRLRAAMLRIGDAMRYYDMYPPLVSSERRYPIEEAKQLMLDAVKPLGEAYVEAMASGLRSRWMDVYPRPRKLAGAHVSGAAYDVHPYVLMNYSDNFESLATLAHEWGHAMHSHLSNAAQPFVTADYATFVAEIASTFNEALLHAHLLKGARNDDERLFYLGSWLETLRATFFRQAMFAEFEREVHARVDRGEPLTGAALSKLYGELLRRYHGENEGVMQIDELYSIEWAYVPHFYHAFYVFQYATSIAASTQLADAVLKGERGARERYLRLLAAGGSDYPYELVKAAGVNLATPEPYRAIASRMNRVMDEIQAILARRTKP